MSSLSTEADTDVIVSRPGVRVNLTCPVEKEDASVVWGFDSPYPIFPHNGMSVSGRNFVLKSALPNNSGNYSCYYNSRQIGTLQLLVEGELHPPSFWRQLPARLCAFRRHSLPDPLNSYDFLGHGILGKSPERLAEFPACVTSGLVGTLSSWPCALRT